MGEYEDMLEEIYMERARYFLSADQMLEELLEDENVSGTRKVEFKESGTSEEVIEVSN
jgi:hypothetical protein